MRSRMLGARLFIVATGVVLLASSGCAGRQRPSEPTELAPEPVVGYDERLGVDDVFVVRVVGELEISGEYRVGADGTIDYPYIGRVQVLGMRPSEVQEELTRKLKSGYFRNPQLAVVVLTWNSRKVSVLGQVARPGPLTYFPRMTIVDAIAGAGGFTPSAAKNSVRLRRELNGKVDTRNYRVSDISEGRSPNVIMLPGDLLVVDERMF
jgi:protein involved in polysaccharide export with SLBB domain